MHRYPAILNLGFRLFFFTASAFAVLTMLAWLAVYQFQVAAFSGALPSPYWHGHEMVYGYAAAVVTGFLFTAVQNWTGLPLPHGWPLFCYWLPWFVARLLFAFAPGWQLVAACFDVLFALGSLYGVAKPVLAVKQWRQMGLVSKLGLLVIGQLLFIAGLLGFARGLYWSLYLGVFTILAIVLTIGRRVTPFFTERGVGYPFTPKNSILLDRLCLVSFTVFFVLKIFTPWQAAASVFALASALTNGWRLVGWYTFGIWRRPLLWSMFLSFAGMIFGFFLFFCQLFLAYQRFSGDARADALRRRPADALDDGAGQPRPFRTQYSRAAASAGRRAVAAVAGIYLPCRAAACRSRADDAVDCAGASAVGHRLLFAAARLHANLVLAAY